MIWNRQLRISRPVENGSPRAWHGSESAPYSRSPNGRPVLVFRFRRARQLRRLARSRCSKASSRSAAAPACTSAAPTRARSTTSPPRSSTIRMDEAVAGHATRIEVDARARQPPDRHRQRPRHPGRPAPQISRQVGARSDHDHAPLGREVRGQGLFDLGRPPRRRGQRRQRAVDRDRRRGRARQEALPPELLAGASPTSQLETVGAAPNRRGTTVTFTPDPEIFGADAAFSPERLYKLARSKAYLFAGVEIRWRCDPSLASRRSPRNRRLPVRQRPRRPSRRAARRPPDRHQPALHRPPGLPRRPGQRRMGGRLAALLATAAKAITATPSRPPTAAPTKRASAPR